MRVRPYNLVERAAAAGEIAVAVEPLDMLRAIASLQNAPESSDRNTAARNLTDIMLKGMGKR